MKQAVVAALAVALLGAGALSAGAAGDGTATVVVKKTSIRSARQFYAPTIAEAALGESFPILAREKGWVKVGSKAGDGWLHESAITSKKVAVSSTGPSGGRADDRDIAAAGKGFNPQVESEYRKKNPGANYAAVDRMEKLVASDAAVQAFVGDGRLQPRGAGQ